MSKTPIPGAVKSIDEAAELRSLALDLTQMCFDLAGLFDPTPVSDGASALISLGRGDWLGAALSGASMIPYVGDLAKAGKFPKYLKTLERAIVLAQQSERAAELLRPVISRLDQALQLLPDVSQLREIRAKVAEFLLQNRVARVAVRVLPDISRRFQFPPRFRRGNYEYVQASGELGVPGRVMTHRSPSAQTGVAGGTGDDAGHLIGNRFGAPGGAENLGMQNWVQNRYGTYKQLEDDWAAKLQNGTGVEVVVQDVYRAGETRPFMRRVEWMETAPDGRQTQHQLLFANAHTPRSRDLQGIVPDLPPDHRGALIPVDFVNRRRL